MPAKAPAAPDRGPDLAVGTSAIVAATGAPEDAAAQAEALRMLQAARDFAQPLLAGRVLDTGEAAFAHAQGVAAILADMGASPAVQASAFLVYAGDALQDPQDTVARTFGDGYADLVGLTRRLVQVQRAARGTILDGGAEAVQQIERVRKMLLAFSRDLRVVLLRLASRLQTLRWHVQSRTPCPPALALESRQVFAPLASRLGIWPIKWELEDLVFRLLEPQDYHRIASELDKTRRARELDVAFVCHQLSGVLRAAGLDAQVQGRPKHLYSIWRKMRGKGLAFSQVLDIRALRVIVSDVAACYAALSTVHARYDVVPGEFDDYIAAPKPNGYQSLHTVVLADDGKPLEVQIRTLAMHEHAEHGVAAHWAYKEAGAGGYAGAAADADAAERITRARQRVMQQLLAWERDFSGAARPGARPSAQAAAGDDAGPGDGGADRIYVLTPQATVVELSAGATPVDFAYALHTELGHRCRGAMVDGHLVPLNTRLLSGQTVEVVSARDGGPSRDWLNPELGYLGSPRAKAKVRAWFNAQVLAETVARGRERVERLLQREGRTALKLDDLAERLGFKGAQALFEVVGKDEMSLRQIEALLRPAVPAASDDSAVILKRSRAGEAGVLVVGVESLMTSLARCCRPAPPDAITGFVTRGKGVAVHRRRCSNVAHMARQWPDRVIPVAWGGDAGLRATATSGPLYPVDVDIEAADRQGLLRDISDVLAKERLNVTGVHTQSVRSAGAVLARMTFTLEIPDTARLEQVLKVVAQVKGVRHARRR